MTGQLVAEVGVCVFFCCCCCCWEHTTGIPFHQITLNFSVNRSNLIIITSLSFHRNCGDTDKLLKLIAWPRAATNFESVKLVFILNIEWSALPFTKLGGSTRALLSFSLSVTVSPTTRPQWMVHAHFKRLIVCKLGKIKWKLFCNQCLGRKFSVVLREAVSMLYGSANNCADNRCLWDQFSSYRIDGRPPSPRSVSS